MPVAIIVIAAVVVVAALIALGVYRIRRRKHRIAALLAFAAAHAMSYAKSDDQWAKLNHWGRPFGVGSRRHAVDVLTGPYRGRPAVCFTYRYTTSGPGPSSDSSSSENHYYAVYTLGLPRAVPALRVAYRHPFGEPSRSESARGDFASEFDVSCDDPRFAAAVLDPGMQQWLSAHGRAGFTMIDDRLFIAFPRRMEADRIEYWLDHLSAAFDHIPRAVWAA